MLERWFFIEEVALDEKTCIMELAANESQLVLRALKAAVGKMNPNAALVFPNSDGGRISVGTPGPVIEYAVVPKYDVPKIILYHNGAIEATSELIDIFWRNYLRMPNWVIDN